MANILKHENKGYASPLKCTVFMINITVLRIKLIHMLSITANNAGIYRLGYL